MSIKFLVFWGGGGVFWVWGGGSADFIFMGVRIFLTNGIHVRKRSKKQTVHRSPPEQCQRVDRRMLWSLVAHPCGDPKLAIALHSVAHRVSHQIPAESEMSRQNRATPPQIKVSHLSRDLPSHFPLIRSRQRAKGDVAAGWWRGIAALLGSENGSRYRGVSQLQSHQSRYSVQLSFGDVSRLFLSDFVRPTGIIRCPLASLANLLSCIRLCNILWMVG